MSGKVWRCLALLMLFVVSGSPAHSAPLPETGAAPSGRARVFSNDEEKAQTQKIGKLTRRVEYLEGQTVSAARQEQTSAHRAIVVINLLVSLTLVITAVVAFFGFRGLRDMRRVAHYIRAQRRQTEAEARRLLSVDLNKQIAPEIKNTLEELGRRLEQLESLGQPLEATDYVARGDAYYAQGDYAKAGQWYERAIAARPDFVEAYYRKGVALHQLGKYEEALTCFQKVAQLKPDDVQASYVEGLVLQKMGEYPKAIASYSRAISLLPQWPKPYLHRAAALARLGRIEESLSDLALTLDLDPGGSEEVAKDPDFQTLRSRAEYQTLLRALRPNGPAPA